MTSSSSPSRKALSKIACNRLQKELAEWQLSPPAGFKHKVSDNLQRWVIEVTGAAGTLYAGETYQLQVDFPEHYPMEAPQVIFLNPAPMHPHIYSNGHICLDVRCYYSNCYKKVANLGPVWDSSSSRKFVRVSGADH
ncbi:Ubiquitin-conjugating enzyme 15 [Zea mays]|uniref:Ubiquitin-conjugating enzyme 15 n=1 Tax=Zea mays TaxID=4577 RepID=A0A3L6D698_MAIZE|nr:Ubiquitin-conjugating enzyme 15 [Zea mays]